MPVQRFVFRFAPAYRRAARVFGVAPGNVWAELDDKRLLVRFGRWRLETPLANITGVEITGPYAFLKTAGPARLAVTDRGLTFATNSDAGVLISFRTPVPGIEPSGHLRHPELTLTVAEVDRFASVLRERVSAAAASGEDSPQPDPQPDERLAP